MSRPYGFDPSSKFARDCKVSGIFFATELGHVHVICSNANGIVGWQDCRMLGDNLENTMQLAPNF